MPQQPAAMPTSVTGRRPVGGDEATISTSQADVVEKQHNSEYIKRTPPAETTFSYYSQYGCLVMWLM